MVYLFFGLALPFPSMAFWIAVSKSESDEDSPFNSMSANSEKPEKDNFKIMRILFYNRKIKIIIITMKKSLPVTKH